MAPPPTQPMVEFVAHSACVTCLSFDASGDLLASGGEDKKIHLWPINGSINSVATLNGHTSGIESVQFGRNENVVCAGSSTGSLKLWDINTTQLYRNLTGHKMSVGSIDFHPYGQYLTSGCVDSTIKLWDMRKKNAVFSYKGHSGHEVRVLRFSPDGHWLASGGDDGIIKIWDLVSGKVITQFEDHEGPITDLVFHPNELLVTSSSLDGTVRFWDLESFTEVSNTMADSGPVHQICYNPSGTTLYSASRDQLDSYEWEPVNKIGSLPVTWGKIKHLMMGQSDRLMAASTSLLSVSIFVMDPDVVTKTSSNNNLHRTHHHHSNLHHHHVTSLNSTTSTSSAFMSSTLMSNAPSSSSQQPPSMDRSRMHLLLTSPLQSSNLNPISTNNNNNNNNHHHNHLNPPAPIITPSSCPPGSATSGSSTSSSSSSATSMQTVKLPPLPTVNIPPASRPPIITTTSTPSTPATTVAAKMPPPKAAVTPNVHGPKVTPTQATNRSMAMGPQRRATHQVAPTAMTASAPVTPSTVMSSTLFGSTNHLNKGDPFMSPSHRPPVVHSPPPLPPPPPSSSQSVTHSVTHSPSLPVTMTQDAYWRSPMHKPTAVKASAIVYPKPHMEKSPPSSLPQDMMDLIPENRDHPLGLDIDNFLPKHLKHSMSRGDDPPDMTEQEAMMAIMKGHRSFIAAMGHRRKNLSIILAQWSFKDPVKALDKAVQSQDDSCIVDILNVINLKPSIWTLDMCQALLPQIQILLTSRYETYMSTGCASLKIILKNFGQIIKSNIKTSPNIGVDISREERFTKCMECDKVLNTIRSSILKQQTVRGKLGQTFREITSLMQTIEG